MNNSQPKDPQLKESQLYEPVKAFLERQGFEVKGEVGHCDLLAQRGDEALLAVELKTSLNLDVVLQAVDQTRIAEQVYVAVPERGARSRLASRSGRRRIRRMFQMLGLGLMTVGFRTPSGSARSIPRIDVLIEPAPYQPRKNLRHARRLQQEFHARAGDRNVGGTRQSKRVTAYRQDALICARYVADNGVCAPAAVRRATGVTRAGSVLYRNVYGWFERPGTGQYTVSASGRRALVEYRELVAALTR